MSSNCPHCGHSLDTEQPDTLAQLRAWCEANGHHITPLGAVYEDAAAAILDRSPSTLANRRANGGVSVPYSRSGRNGRITYRLDHLAAYIDSNRSPYGTN
jgi:hypothetical protein